MQELWDLVQSIAESLENCPEQAEGCSCSPSKLICSPAGSWLVENGAEGVRYHWLVVVAAGEKGDCSASLHARNQCLSHGVEFGAPKPCRLELLLGRQRNCMETCLCKKYQAKSSLSLVSQSQLRWFGHEWELCASVISEHLGFTALLIFLIIFFIMLQLGNKSII